MMGAGRRVRMAALAAALAAWVVTGCGQARGIPQQMQQQTQHGAEQSAAAVTLPLLQLAPAALGYTLAEQQQLVVVAPDGSQRHLHVLLEVEADSVRLALTHWGQVLASVAWDGQTLRVQRAPHLPSEVRPERVLSDLQLALWPQEAVARALPPDWSLQVAGPGQRALLHRGAQRVTVQLQPTGGVWMHYVQEGWGLQVLGASQQSLQGLRGEPL